MSLVSEGLFLVLLLDKDDNIIVEQDTPTIIQCAHVDGKEKFITLTGAEIGDVRNAGYTLVDLKDVNAVVKKGRDIRFYQKT